MANQKKRRALPSALHSELTEYSSLLRTLRTNNILDVSLHLTQRGRDSNNPVSDESQEPTWQEQITDAVYNGDGANRKRKRHCRKRDNWTRWPLLLKDLSKPTWNFEDEVAIVASHVLKLKELRTTLPSSQESRPEDDLPTRFPEHTEHVSQHSSDAEDNDFDVDGPDIPTYYKYLAMSASNFLSNALALIASHTPLRPQSMQNRIEPLNWRSVLEIVSAHGDYNVVDEHMLNRIQARMETLYELPAESPFPELEDGESLVAFRLRKRNEAERQLDNDMSQAFESLFEFPPPGFMEPMKPKRRRKAGTQDWENPSKVEANAISSDGVTEGKGEAIGKDRERDKGSGAEEGQFSSQAKPHVSSRGKVGRKSRDRKNDRNEAMSPKSTKETNAMQPRPIGTAKDTNTVNSTLGQEVGTLGVADIPPMNQDESEGLGVVTEASQNGRSRGAKLKASQTVSQQLLRRKYQRGVR